MFDIACFCWNSQHVVPVLANITWVYTVQGEWQAWRKTLQVQAEGRGITASHSGCRLARSAEFRFAWSDSSNTLCSCPALLLFQLWHLTQRWIYWLLYFRWQLFDIVIVCFGARGGGRVQYILCFLSVEIIDNWLWRVVLVSLTWFEQVLIDDSNLGFSLKSGSTVKIIWVD